MDPVESLSEMLGKISKGSEKVSLEQYSTGEIKMFLDYLKTCDKNKLGPGMRSSLPGWLNSINFIVRPTFSYSDMGKVVELEQALEEELRRREERQSDIDCHLEN